MFVYRRLKYDLIEIKEILYCMIACKFKKVYKNDHTVMYCTVVVHEK